MKKYELTQYELLKVRVDHKPPPPCCVVEQDTLLPKSTRNTQKAVALFGLDLKIVDRDLKPQHKYKRSTA